ncbi:MAG: hypothetical protein Q4P24_16200 [Rhodobacterales bacterium]|nr:hypothetical protein [Rhodobacterales bacterium]
MDRAKQFQQLVKRCAREGIAVVEARLPGTLTGVFDLHARRVYLRRGMTAGQQLATLAHELEHARRGDDGHQGRAVEDTINEKVAAQLISVSEYASAERLHGGHSGAIALELDLPRWVVSAYRRRLWRVGLQAERAG